MGCCTSKEDDKAGKGDFTDLQEESQKKAKGGGDQGTEGPTGQAKPKQATKEEAKLSQYENTDAVIEAPKPAPVEVEEPQASKQEPPVALKAGRSNIVELKAAAKPTPKPAPKPSSPVLQNGGPQESTIVAHKPIEVPAVAGSALAALLASGDGASIEDEKELTRKVKETMQHEVAGPKSMFGGSEEEIQEAPKRDGQRISTEVVETLRFVPEDEDEEPPVEPTKAAPTESNFPSAAWFAENGLSCPSRLNWWQSMEQVTLEVQVAEPKELNVCVKEPNTFIFSCTSGGNKYRLNLALHQPVLSRDVETRLEKGSVIVTMHKKENIIWPPRLLDAERSQYYSLDWVHYDSAKSADESDSSDEEDEED
mmetsp:Transcript_92563/g.160447  ORF Transcript_92563/g.160447 Transcript_92563/m.160447 type:complete len:367 (-) Transcript_92563:666-1766(-)